MQNGLKYLIVSSVFGLTFSGCERPETPREVTNNLTVKTELFDFRGEQGRVDPKFPKELFNQSQEDFDNYFKAVSENTRLREASTNGISYEEVLPILKKHLSKYPRINSEDPIETKDLARIFNDIPSITTAEEANSKKEIIYDFYQAFAKRDIVAEVIAFENSNRTNERTTDVSPQSLTTPEKNHLLLNPGYAQWYVQAANDVNSLVFMIYNNDNQDVKANAFKHATWNALSIRYILKGAPASENQAIDFTQDGTSKHEQDDNGNQKHTEGAAMDLHNNMSARVWMESETKWGIGPFRKMPSVDDIINTMIAKANSGPLVTKTAILNLYGGDNAATWNVLYNNMYGPHQHLVHLLP